MFFGGLPRLRAGRVSGRAWRVVLALPFAFALLPSVRADVGRVEDAQGPTGPPAFALAQGVGASGGAVFVRDLAGEGSAALLWTSAKKKTRVYRVRTERGLKAFGAERILSGFGGSGARVALCDGSGDGRPLICAIDRAGALWTARRRPDGTYQARRAGSAPYGVRLLAGDVDGDRLEDLVVLWRPDRPARPASPDRPDPIGRGLALLIRATGREDVFDPPILYARDVPPSARLVDLQGDGRAALCWLEDDRLLLRTSEGGVGKRTLLARGVRGPILAIGDLDGDGLGDLVVPGAWLLRSAHGFQRLPDARLDDVWDAERTRSRGLLCAGDVDGDGRDDLVHLPLTGRRDARVLLSRPESYYRGVGWQRADTDHDGLTDLEELCLHRTDPLRPDTDRDGLADGFEVKGFRGVDLPGLGADPRHRDIFLELDVQQGASWPRVRRAIRRTTKLFQGSPLSNPDGETGIRLHCLVDTRVPRWPGKTPHRHTVRELFFTPRRAGLFHWMFLGATGGGGQADLLSDQGGCAGVFEATLPHELGHQLGLRHGGRTPMNGIPIYPSLMNYAYNYRLGGKRDQVRFSDGALAGLELDERALPERMALPPERLRFLSGPPFFFRLEGRAPTGRSRSAAPEPAAPGAPPGAGPKAAPAPRHRETWVDWDRDGIEDEAPVRANINAAAGAGYGPRHILDKDFPKKGQPQTSSKKAAILVALAARGESVPERLALIYVDAATDRPMLRTLGAEDMKAIGPPQPLSDATGLDHLSAVAEGDTVRLFARQRGRVVELRGTLERRPWTLRVVKAPAATWAKGARVPAVALRKGAKGAQTWLALSDPETGRIWVGRETRTEAHDAAPFDGRFLPSLGTETPVGLAWDSVQDELLLAFTRTQERIERRKTVKRPFRLRLARLAPTDGAVRSVEWVGGPKGSDATSKRPALLFETAPWLPPGGRVDIFHAGVLARPRPNRHMYRSYTIGDRAWRGRNGWKEDRTWNEWSYSLDAPGAAWYRGRPWQVTRFYTHYKGPDRWNDHLALAPRADGVCDRGLRDTNDWEIVDRTGLWRSILQTRVPKGRRAVGPTPPGVSP